MAQKFVTPVTIRNLTSASSDGLAVSVDGDTNDRIKVEAGGRIVWGSGSATGDVNLYRSGTGAIKTDHTLEAESGVITMTTSGAPTSTISDGAIAIDTTNSQFYFRANSAWNTVSGGATVSDTAPSNPATGDIWFESDTGDIFVYYDSTWIDVGGTSVANIAVSDTAPSSPANGDIWFETDTAKTFVWYDDGSSQQWVEIGAASAAANGADGSIQFASGGTFSSDGTNLFWDDANNRLGVGTNSPAVALDVVGTTDTDYLTIGGENVTPYTGKRNLLINGAMQVYQRASSGAVGTSESYICADRWKSARTVNAGGTLSVNTTDAPEGFNNSLNYACTTAEATATNETFVSQVLEGQDVQHIGYGKSWCKEVTVSFWVKSNVTGTFNVWFYRWDGSRHIGRSYTINSADTWEHKTVLVPAETSNAVANDNTQGWEARFYLGAQSAWTGGTEASSWSSVSDGNRAPGNGNINSSTSNYWRITGVQVEVGDTATPFEHRSFGEELSLCQRYFQLMPKMLMTTNSGGFQNSYAGTFMFNTAMRTTPSLEIFTGYNYGGTSGKFNFYVSGAGTAQTPAYEALSEAGFQTVYYGYASYSLMAGSWKASAEL